MISKQKKDPLMDNTSLLPEEELSTDIESIEEPVDNKMLLPEQEKKDPSILDMYNEYVKKSDEDYEKSRTMDEISSLVNSLGPILSARSRARAIMSAGSTAADPGLITPNLKTNRAEESRNVAKDRIGNLLQKYKLQQSLKPAGPKLMKIGDRLINVDPITGTTKELYRPQISAEELAQKEEDRELEREAKQLNIQKLEKELSRKPGDDLTLEQKQAALVDIELKQLNAQRLKQQIEQNPEMSDMEKFKRAAEIDRMMVETERSRKQIEQMSQPKQPTELERAKIAESLARAERLKSPVATDPLQQAKLETEKLKQESLKSKQADVKAQTQDRLDKLDEQMNDLIKAEEGLKKGGVTGFIDNSLGRVWGMMTGNKSQETRKLLDKIETEITLLGSGSLKGAISDKEISLLKQPVPSKFEDEKVWKSWIKDRMQILEKARKNVASKLNPNNVSSQTKQATTMSKQNEEALNWARNNPNDPRSAEILKRLGM